LLEVERELAKAEAHRRTGQLVHRIGFGLALVVIGLAGLAVAAWYAWLLVLPILHMVLANPVLAIAVAVVGFVSLLAFLFSD
jgi:hypothetical protein